MGGCACTLYMYITQICMALSNIAYNNFNVTYMLYKYYFYGATSIIRTPLATIVILEYQILGELDNRLLCSVLLPTKPKTEHTCINALSCYM